MSTVTSGATLKLTFEDARGAGLSFVQPEHIAQAMDGIYSDPRQAAKVAVATLPQGCHHREKIQAAQKRGVGCYILIAACTAAREAFFAQQRENRRQSAGSRASARAANQASRAQACQAAKGSNPTPPKYGTGKAKKNKKTRG
jgi:hypothetical protein